MQSKMITITNRQTLEAVSLADASQLLRCAYTSMPSARGINHQRQRTHVAGARLSTLGGILPELGVMGAKVYASCGGSTGFAIVLFSSNDGRPLCALEGEAVTQLRGSATTALAADILAPERSNTLSIFGTGVQARAHIEALGSVRSIKRVLVVPHSSGADYIAWARSKFDLDIQLAPPAQAAAEGDMILLATRAARPLLRGNLLQPGAFVAALGSSTLDAREVDDDCVRNAGLIVVDGKLQAREEAGDLAVDAVNWDNIVELGQLLTAGMPPDVDRRSVRFYKSVGLGIADVAVAAAAHARITGRWDDLSARLAGVQARARQEA
jgi:ornithine cyclodeaminase